MKNLRFLAIVVIASVVALSTGCRKQGCTDSNANNFDGDAKKDDGSCVYPTITVNPAGDDGDVVGAGGSASTTVTWNNSLTTAELNMDITPTSVGSLQIVVTDANGVEVLNETLSSDDVEDSKTVCSATGTAGAWTVTITLTSFTGNGSYTLSQGC